MIRLQRKMATAFFYDGDCDKKFRSQGHGSLNFEGSNGIDALNYSRSDAGVNINLIVNIAKGGFGSVAF
ncbi:MAG: hypothetical protein ACI93B_001940 [Yoonia sp.]|jgi:hypothetical protein